MAVVVNVGDLADQMHVDNHVFYELARRESDPLPLGLLPGRQRGAAILVSDFEEWWRRNNTPFKEVGNGD